MLPFSQLYKAVVHCNQTLHLPSMIYFLLKKAAHLHHILDAYAALALPGDLRLQ